MKNELYNCKRKEVVILQGRETQREEKLNYKNKPRRATMSGELTGTFTYINGKEGSEARERRCQNKVIL